MNDNKNFEFLTEEELKKMDENLKARENIQLPQSLSKENMAQKLKEIPQQEVTAVAEPKKKRNTKKIVFRTMAAAAAVIVAVTSIAIAKPWAEKPPVIKESVVGEEPKAAEDYTEIEAMFAEYAKKQKEYRQSFNYGSSKDDFFVLNESASMDMMAQSGSTVAGSSENKSAASSATGSSHGKTNEQVQGVNEADIIKNDGRYIYTVNPDNADWSAFYSELRELSGELEETTGEATEYKKSEQHIYQDVTPTEKSDGDKKPEEIPVLNYDCSVSVVEPQKNGSLKKVAVIDIAKPEDKSLYYMTISELYVSNDRLVAIVNCSSYDTSGDITKYGTYWYSHAVDCMYYGDDSPVTMAVSFDISDKKNPTEEWRIYQDGRYVSSRLIGDELVLLSDYYVDISEDEDTVKASCVPEISVNDSEFSRISGQDICIMDEVCDSRYLVASVMDTDDESTVKTEAVLGGGDNAYCTTETLYVTSSKYVASEEKKEIFAVSDTVKTQIYKFDISNYDIKYLKNASVDGSALNQFSIDEYNGMLRIATTSGSWGENLVNQLYLLNENLETVGLLKDIAQGERIKSVRFTGTTAYVVTFIQTDPLFVIDLSEPSEPKILGELKIPGYSAYLHPVGDGLVMGVGLDGDDSGTNGGMKISLFDVSDPTAPEECAKFVTSGYDSSYGWCNVQSEAYYTHKAMCWDEDNKIMYVPYGKYENIWVANNGSSTYEKNTAGVIAIKVNEADKALVPVGEYIANSTDGILPREFARTTYIDNIIFGYSQNENILCSFDKATQKQLDTIAF